MEHKDAIIACFKNVGLSLAVDGSENHLLKVRDCPSLTVGDWQKAPGGTAENPAVINEDGESTIEVDGNEDENDVTTDSGVESDEEEESDFDDAIDGDEDMEDENM